MPTPQSNQQAYLDMAIADDLVRFFSDGRSDRILYVPVNHSERWSDPEEAVRAELWSELIYKYDYPAERILFETIVPRRTPGDKADLVVYSDDELKSPYFVFECKRIDLSDAAFLQAIEQACGNRASLGAPYCAAIAGRTRRLLTFDGFPPGERHSNHLADIPVNYGQPLDWRFYKTSGHDLVAVSREDLRSTIRKCHQTLWEGGKRSPISAFGEFCKLVFIKHRDEKDVSRLQGDPYYFQRRTGESDEQLAERIHQLYAAEQQNDPDVFSDDINVDDAILAQCVEHLEAISLDRTELDTKGVAFEEFMGSFFKGDFGQYFTPRELVAFCVAALDPQRLNMVLDPACGSAGFLLYAMDHVRRRADYVQTPGTIEHYKFWHHFAQHNLFGIEVNEELARVAKMNMIIHDDGHTNIVGNDALDFPSRISSKNSHLKAKTFDLVLTNPPFGATIRRTEKGDGYLEQFDLLKYLSKHYPDRKTRRASIKTEIAFIERIWHFLKPQTGRAAVILPDSILTNSSLQGVRSWLLTHFQLLAVISLPQFAFSHYDAGVKASIVFFRRLGEEEPSREDHQVFMALVDNIGYDAAGRQTFGVTTKQEDRERGRKEEIHRCELFDYLVSYEWSRAADGARGWGEQSRGVIPGTGLVEHWKSFLHDPSGTRDNMPIQHDPEYLGGIDHLVLAALGIDPQPPQAKIFRVSMNSLKNNRFDPDYHSPKFRAIRDSIHLGQFQAYPLEDICEYMETGFAAGPDSQAYDSDTGIPHLRPLNFDIYGRLSLDRTKYVPKGTAAAADLCQHGEVLFNNTNSTHMVGKSAVFEFAQDCACSNHVTRLKTKEGVDAHYVAAVLNALRSTGYLGLLSTNFNNQAGINKTTLGNLSLPVPPLEIQQQISHQVNQLRIDAQELVVLAQAMLAGTQQ